MINTLYAVNVYSHMLPSIVMNCEFCLSTLKSLYKMTSRMLAVARRRQLLLVLPLDLPRAWTCGLRMSNRRVRQKEVAIRHAPCLSTFHPMFFQAGLQIFLPHLNC